jgi:hypothetical protein
MLLALMQSFTASIDDTCPEAAAQKLEGAPYFLLHSDSIVHQPGPISGDVMVANLRPVISMTVHISTQRRYTVTSGNCSDQM